MKSAPWVSVPVDHRVVGARGAGSFVTRVDLVDADGRAVRWSSRAHRKGQVGAGGTWWRPGRRAWWIAVLFAVGAACFAAAGLWSQADAAAGEGPARLQFAGSLPFTAAAYLQWAEAVNAARGIGRSAPGRRWRPGSWEPRRIDWLATAIQLCGTLLFNLSTAAALQDDLSATRADVRVWLPGVLGCVAFVASSQLAVAETCHRWLCLRERTLSWWVVALNLLGSVAFGVSAAGSLVTAPSGVLVDGGLADAGTWVGGALFLVAAVLLIPEAARLAQPARRP